MGGRWSNPDIWREGTFDENGRLIASAPAEHAPDGDDDVMFIAGYAPDVPYYDRGPIIGGGSADDVFVQGDFGNIPLTGDGQRGLDHYRFDSIALEDRNLYIGRGAVLMADEMTIDGSSALIVSDASSAIDTKAGGIAYSARIGDLTVEGPGGRIDLGSNNVLTDSYQNENPDGVSGTGRVIELYDNPAPEPDPVDWNAVAARVEAYHALTGDWWDPGPGWEPDPHTGNPPPRPEPVDWDAIAAQVLANYEATGSWWY